MNTESNVPAPTSSAAPRAFAAPPVDVFESKEGFVLLAELPGVNAEGVSVNLEREVLSIEARREDQSLDYRRRFELSVPVDADRVQAKLEQGVLRIELPKAASARARSIPVA